MKAIVKYIKGHYDFLVVDLTAYVIFYLISVGIRRSVNLRITHGELFLEYGLVSILIYFIVEIFNKNLSGVMSRSMIKEGRAVLLQMLVSWSFYTVVLYMIKEARDFSRALYLTTFVLCTLGIFVFRSIWKAIVRATPLRKKYCPRLIIVCDAPKGQENEKNLMSGFLNSQYELAGLVMTEEGEPAFYETYPHFLGLDHLPALLSDDRITAAYVDLEDAGTERQVIEELLNAGVTVHRGLGDSKFDYSNQHINEISGRAVITIDGTKISAITKLENKMEQMQKQMAGKMPKG